MADIEAKTITRIRGDCGHEFTVSIRGITPDTDLICPECGSIDHLTADQIAGIIDSLNKQIAQGAIKQAAGIFRESIKRG